MSAQPVRVALVFGGVSSEHEISCLTAGGVARAIDPSRFEVIGIGIAKDGRWLRIPLEDVKALKVVGGALPIVDPEYPEALVLRAAGGANVGTIDGTQLIDMQPFDVAFTLLHGPFGEDGTIQGMFEMLDIRYVGAGVAASAIGMDKDLMKRSMTAAGLPVAPWVAFPTSAWLRDKARIAEDIAELGYPVFVKPARGGSSVGISRADDPEQLEECVAAAQQFDPKVIVEKGLMGCREIEVAVLGGRGFEQPRASVPGEIILHAGRFYDFAAKYLPADEQVTLAIPAELDEDLTAAVRELAAHTFTVMNVEGLARVDLFVDSGGEVYVNELNTMPGFTATSMFPRLWQATGVEYPELVAELIELALDRPLGLR
ncbi:MAG: D-alanine--D-alanine ligase [Propionibacteriaceae bacterium]|jgi:D-alanine-D-alanine ligase|nr:D-alanine--D-alanine ligase [Propionibacteriaceae bacterium]